MDIFMRNIPGGATEMDIKLAFVSILHGPPLRKPDEDPMNFEVRIFRKIGRQGHRCGILTLPTTEAAGTLLLASPVVRVKGVSLLLSQSNQGVDQATVQRIRSTPWEDPEILRRQKEAMEEGSKPLSVRRISFGRLCRDSVFSAEVDFTDKSLAVTLDMARRRLSVSITDTGSQPHSYSLEALLGGLFTLSVQRTDTAYLLSSQITALCVSEDYNGHPYTYVETDTPPTFYSQVGLDFRKSLLDEEPAKVRTTSLNNDSTMQYVTRGLYIAFESQQDLQLFRERCKQMNLPRPSRIDNGAGIPLVHRGIYSPDRMQKVDSLLSRLLFEVAFEAERAMMRGELEPQELLNLESTIVYLQHKHGSSFVDIFRTFTSRLEIPALSHRGGRRAGRRATRTAQSISPSELEKACDLYFRQLSRPRRKLRLWDSSPTINQTYHLIITPSTRVLEGPLVERSNSVLRRFGHTEHFLRVSFEDENRSKLHQSPELSIEDILKERVRSTLVKNIRLAGRDYDSLLGYSMSGLREHSLWAVRPWSEDDGTVMDAGHIRGLLGNFRHIERKPARLAARWAQAFSTSDPTIELEGSNVHGLQDHISSTNSVFTDGCGTISSTLAREVTSKMVTTSGPPPRMPLCGFQFRYGGYKGVLVENPRLPGRTVGLRPSQRKFDAPLARSLDVTELARPIAMYLNRPLIMFMEYLGVNPKNIFSLQESAMSAVHRIWNSLSESSTLFLQHGLGVSFHLPSLFSRLRMQLDLDFSQGASSFGFRHSLIDESLAYGATHVLREIKYRGRILVPGSVTLMGVSDEWDCLDEGQIFATVYDQKTQQIRPIEGKVLITRSPQCHPGDLQFVNAVRPPELQHLSNVVVFSCKGDRSLPSCLGGGDLDGDIYNLILDDTLFPERICEAGAYKALQDKEIDRPCTVNDIADFFVDYIKSDLVGYISTLQMRIADLQDPGVDDCIKLAEYNSHAVDFPKTGTPVSAELLPRIQTRVKPDFLAVEGTDPSRSPIFYPSVKLLGRLFRNVPMEVKMPQPNLNDPTGRESILHALGRVRLARLHLPALHQPSDDLIHELEELLEAYTDQLYTIGQAYSLSSKTHLSEGELVSGTIQARWYDHRKRTQAVTAMNLQTHQLVKAIQQDLRGQRRIRDINAQHNQSTEVDHEETAEEGNERRSKAFQRAYAAWTVSDEVGRDDPAGFGYQSFGLIALGVLLDVIAEARETRTLACIISDSA